jgi:lysyl-tRNA synthetase, class II
VDRLSRLKRLGIALYPARGSRTHTIAQIYSSDQSMATPVISGRLRTLNISTGTCVVEDASGCLSLKLEEHLDAETTALLNELEEGDIVECGVRRTTEEMTLQSLRMLVPALGPLHDIVHDASLTLKSEILTHTSRFFQDHGFLNVETPHFMGVPDLTPGISSFKTTYHDPAGRTIDYYLQSSPEHYMKRLLALGYENIFQICRFFRDGERYDTHHPEFIGLEWYQAYDDYKGVMATTEEYITSMAINITGDSTINYQGQDIDLGRPWPRRRVNDMIRELTGIDLEQCTTRESLSAAVADRGVDVAGAESREDLFHRLFVDQVEPELPRDRPILLMDYPAYLPSLARSLDSDPQFVERFELYIGGLELANAFTELNDPREQRERYENLLKSERTRGYSGGIDEQFIQALEYGMPPAGGIALGIDRLAMIFADTSKIDDVIAFRNY